MLTAIEEGAANTIADNMMLLGVAAPTVAAAADAVEDAQDAYDAKFAEINSATYTDAEEATETGFRAALTAELEEKSLMLDAQEAASSAEATAISNYEDQEAVVNALLVIEGCAAVSYADLGLTSEEEEETESGTEAALALELTQYEECCTSRLSTYLASLSAEDENGGDCTTNAGWGFEGERVTRTST